MSDHKGTSDGQGTSPDSLDTSNLRTNPTLNPQIWGSDKQMLPAIRLQLLRIARRFFDYLDLPGDVRLGDITLTGSLANYNHSPHSDADLHLVMDVDSLGMERQMAEKYLKTQKTLFNGEMDIRVAGFPVELYVQPSDQPHRSTGVYSVAYDRWRTEPVPGVQVIDREGIRNKAAHWTSVIGSAIGSGDPELITRMQERLASMRSHGLASGGEWDTENLVYKVLRHNGVLDRLWDAGKELESGELSRPPSGTE